MEESGESCQADPLITSSLRTFGSENGSTGPPKKSKMNAEHLHAIALAVQNDLRVTGSVRTLQQLRDALQNMVNQPQQVSHQQQVNTLRQQLLNALSEAPSNEFQPTWQQALEELGAWDVLGDRLLSRVQEIFVRYQVTPVVAHQGISELCQELERVNTAVGQLTASFTQLDIGKEDLAPGECEVGVLIPRDAVQSRLDGFISELATLNNMLRTFSELETGTREPFEIRSISSSNLAMYVGAVPAVAAMLSHAVAKIITSYKEVLEIRTLRSQLAQKGIQDQRLLGIDEYANSIMEATVAGLVEKLMAENRGKVEEPRRNELANELTFALNALANRIDRGFNIEVRVEPLPEANSEGESGEDENTRNAIASILVDAPALRFLKLEGTPILALPEPDGPEPFDEDGEDEGESGG